MEKAELMLRIATFSVLLLSGLWYLGSTTVWQIVKLRGQVFNVTQAARSCQIESKETNKLLREARKEAKDALANQAPSAK